MDTYFETSRLHAQGVNDALNTIVDNGGEVITLSEEEIGRMRTKVIEEVWPKIAERSERCAKGVELWEEFLKDIGKL